MIVASMTVTECYGPKETYLPFLYSSEIKGPYTHSYIYYPVNKPWFCKLDL